MALSLSWLTPTTLLITVPAGLKRSSSGHPLLRKAYRSRTAAGDPQTSLAGESLQAMTRAMLNGVGQSAKQEDHPLIEGLLGLGDLEISSRTPQAAQFVVGSLLIAAMRRSYHGGYLPCIPEVSHGGDRATRGVACGALISRTTD